MNVYAIELYKPRNKIILPDHDVLRYRTSRLALISVIHADDDGCFQVEDYSRLAETLEESKYIISCYPYMVKRQYSEFRDKIIGNWYGITRVNLSKDNRFIIISNRHLPACDNLPCEFLY